MVEAEQVMAPELAGAGGWINTAEPLSLAALRGKVVILDFWTFCCINCLHIIEELRPLEAAFPTELVIVGVHSPKFPEEHDHDAVVRAVARHRITHPVLDDPDMFTWRRYGVRAWPTLMVIDPRGVVRGAVSGEGHAQALFKAVEALIREAREQGTLDAGRPIRLAGTAAVRGVPRDTGALAFPGKVATDGSNRLAIADTDHDRILIVGLTAGDGGPMATIERQIDGLHGPQGLYFDGERLVVANTLADEVIAIDLGSDAQTVLATGISSPWDVTPWQGGIAVAEAGKHRLWFIESDNGEGNNGESDNGTRNGRGNDAVGANGGHAWGAAVAMVLAGTSGEDLTDGQALDSLLAQPSGLAVAADGALLFLDSETSSLRRLKDGRVTTLVGQGLFDWGAADGDRHSARLQHPLGIAAAPDGSVYIADTFNSLLRLWRDGLLSTLPVHGLNEPGGLCMLPDGRLAVADSNNHRIVLVEPATGAMQTLGLPSVEAGSPGEQRLAAGALVQARLDLDLSDDELDPSDGPPVRVSVSADPPRLLAAGPRSWALESLPAELEIATGSAATGTLTFDLRAASCKGDLCRLHTRRLAVPVVLVDDGTQLLEL